MVDVLILDDDADLRELISEVLSDQRLTCHTASNGVEALAWLGNQSNPPEVILSDVMMPQMDGLMFRRELLVSSWGTIPFIFMTASAVAEDVVKELGVSYLLKKPVTIDSILWAIRQFIPTLKPTG